MCHFWGNRTAMTEPHHPDNNHPDGRPAAGPPGPVVRIGCLGCLGWLGLAALWALLALLPLGAADDIFGGVLNVHWSVFPAAAPPTGTSADAATSDWDDTTVRVPPGSLMTLSVKEVSSSLRFDDFQPTVACFTREADQPWVALPPREIPVIPDVTKAGPDLKTVRLHSFRTTTGRLTVRCAGSEYLDLNREDPGVQRELHLSILAARIVWPVVVTALLGVPLALIRRRRRGRRPVEYFPGPASGRSPEGQPVQDRPREPGSPPDGGPPPPWGSP